ncbi:MAG: alpha/beta hydrolase [Solirubrobacterales bacterium]
MGELVHLLREPAAAPDGALILNHGRATNERDLYPLLEELDPERRLLGVTTGAPLTNVPPGGRRWYLVPRVGYPDPETFASSYGLLTGLCDALLEEHGIGWERTVLGGFSMGAVMSYAVGLGPGRPSPAAILAFSGFVPTVDGWDPELGGRGRLPVLIHHGRADRSSRSSSAAPPKSCSPPRGSRSNTSRPTPRTRCRASPSSAQSS